jgi:hypothetical protein
MNRNHAVKRVSVLIAVREMGGTLCIALLALALLSTPAFAQMQTTCIPYGDGGAYAPGPPTWWLASGTGFARFNTWVDDPRWLGSTSITYGQGATKELQFRALYNPQTGANRYVYLSWWFKAALDTSTNPNAINNRLYVGLRSASGTGGLLMKIEMQGGTAQVTSSASRRSVALFPVNADGSFGAQIAPSPTWSDDVRVWVDDTTDQSTQIPPSPNNPEANNWAIHVRVPIDVPLGTGVTLGSSFNLWYELLQGTPKNPTTPGSPGAPGNPVISYTWPRSTSMQSFGVESNGFVERVPATLHWPPFKLNEPGNTCQSFGIDIEWPDIKVTNPAAPAGSTNQINIGVANTFSATPTNSYNSMPPRSVNTEDLHARFRIANWGIQPTMPDQPDPSTGAWTTVGGLGNVQQLGGSIAQGSKWNLTGNWNPTALDFPATRSRHQCVMVELFGTNLDFIHSSAFINTRIAPASIFEDEAEVSTVGLAQALAPNRDVYLSVQTYNMPTQMDPGTGTRPGLDTEKLPEKQFNAKTIEQYETPDQIVERTRLRSREEIVLASEPTYVTRGYFDTGRRITLDGLERQVLQPMVSFGYRMDHQGPLYGWDHRLDGPQNVVEKIGPNFYRVSVPNNSVVKIKTKIMAKESAEPCNCWDLKCFFGRSSVVASVGVLAIGMVIYSSRNFRRKQ